MRPSFDDAAAEAGMLGDDWPEPRNESDFQSARGSGAVAGIRHTINWLRSGRDFDRDALADGLERDLNVLMGDR